MNISRIRINEQLGWIRGPQGNIAFHPVRWSSSGINRFSIVLYPRWPTPMDFNLFPRNAALFSAFRRALSLSLLLSSYIFPFLSFSLAPRSMNYTTRSILWIVPPTNAVPFLPLSTFVRVWLRVRVRISVSFQPNHAFSGLCRRAG